MPLVRICVKSFLDTQMEYIILISFIHTLTDAFRELWFYKIVEF